MDERQMRHVQQIVHDEFVIAFHMQMTGAGFPALTREPWIVRRRDGRGKCGIAHEHPNPFAMFAHREAAHLRARGNACVFWNEFAGAVFVKANAVIETLQCAIALHRAHRQRHFAMRAAIFQRNGAAIFKSIKGEREARHNDAARL